MKTIKVTMLVFALLISGTTISTAKIPSNISKSSSLKKAALKEWKFFDINTIYCTINSEGPYCDYLKTNSSGLFWPKGSDKTAVYTAGIWVIGKHRPTGQLRTAVQDYQTEYQPGKILTTFNTTTNSISSLADPADPKYRIYKVVRKDSVGGNPDYDDWPADLGAPYTDVDGIPGYTKGVDKPFLWGDQVLWCVYNDGNSTAHTNAGLTKPMGIEVQATYFGFDQPGALGNIMFMRWKIINKSDADYDSVFISMWSDTDLGDANDDMVGVDTTAKLAYVYNGDAVDGTAGGYGDKPPANGFVFFQGPRVAGSATDSALFEGKKRPGFRNLPGTSHAAYFNSANAAWTDPPLRDQAFAEQAYNYQNGVVGPTGQPFINPQTNQASKFVFPGDPLTETGWTQKSHPIDPGDARSMISSGPFTLAKGDTQEIVGGFVIAQGADRLNSLKILKLFTNVAQEAFDVNFVLASPPPQPTVRVGELDKKIVLNWGDVVDHTATEAYNYIGAAKNYKFEGYNVYQVAGPNSSYPSKRIATYDLVDNIKTVVDVLIDPETGLPLPKPVVFGSDNGVKRYFVFEQDELNNSPLINGKEYYYAVTSYAYNFDSSGLISGIPQVLENSKSVITVVPRQVAAGDRLGGNVNQVVLTNRAVNGDDAVRPEILNPRQLTGATYEITFNGSNDTVNSWNLKRKGVGPDTMLVTNSTNFAGNDGSPNIDGMVFRVTKPDPGPRRDNQNPSGLQYSASTPWWFTGHTITGDLTVTMDAANAVAYPRTGILDGRGTTVKPYELGKVEIRFSTTQTQKAYRYLRLVPTFPPSVGAPKDSSFIPFIITKGSGFPYQDFVDVPFTVWEVDSLDGSPAPRQLNVGFLENNEALKDTSGATIGAGRIDGKWHPTSNANGGREYIFVFNSTYSATPLASYTRLSTDTTKNKDLQGDQNNTDINYIVWLRARDTVATFANGQKLTIIPNYPLLASRVFTFAGPKNVKNDAKLISEQMEKINVFPNPYFAANKAETNVYQRYVTFTNLPQVATIRIINLAGELVKTLAHNNTTGFERWDLRNEVGLPVASGMYIAYIEIPKAGNRVLKLAIIQPEERPTR